MLKIPFFFGRCLNASFLRFNSTNLAALSLALLIVLAAGTILQASVTGPVAYWSFDEGAGNTAADSSGYDNAGTLFNGPDYVDGRNGYALLFDGIDDYVAIPHSDSLNLANGLTVSAWIYNQAAQNNLLADVEYRVIASKGWAAASAGSWSLIWDKKTNRILFFVRKSSDDGYRYVAFSSGSLTDDWHLVTAVFNSGSVSLYIDGSLAAEPVSLGTTSVKTNSEPVLIGSADLSGSASLYPWHGAIDEVEIFNRALSDEEITGRYNDTASVQSFDFVLSNSGDLTINQGTTAVTNIDATATYGTPENILFRVSGLPDNARATFPVKKCKPGCSAVLKIKIPRHTPPGSYRLTVSGEPEAAVGLKAAAAQAQSTSFNIAVTVPTVATPKITPDGGTNLGPVSVKLTSATPKAAIYYTTDGTEPTESSKRYAKRPFTIKSSAVVRAKAFKRDMNPSEEATAAFTVAEDFSFSLSNSGDKSTTPGSSVSNTISADLTTGSTQSVSFSASGLPSGATASFSSSSCSPSCSSTLTIGTTGSTPAGTSTITVTAAGGDVTQTTTFSLTVSLPTVATPTISPNGGSFSGSVSVTLATATSGASIYYTTDGSTPTQSSSLYTGPMTLSNSAVVKAKAFKSGYNPSAEASVTFTFSPKVNLTWQDNSTNEANFQIERKTGSGGVYVQIASVAANVRSYVDASVANGTMYCYRARAVNSSMTSSYSNETCIVTP